jgi:hypothetical protein
VTKDSADTWSSRWGRLPDLAPRRNSSACPVVSHRSSTWWCRSRSPSTGGPGPKDRRSDATERMQIMTEFGQAMGLNIDVEVVSSDDPVEVVRQAVTTASEPFDEIIVIDRPEGVRRWLADHAIDELRRDPGLPLTRLDADPPMRQGKHFDPDELRKHFQEYLKRTVACPEA